jgi:hypothetical protein
MRLIDADKLTNKLEKLDTRYDSGSYCRNTECQLLLRKNVLETVGEMQSFNNVFMFPCSVNDKIYFIPNKDVVIRNTKNGKYWMNRVFICVVTKIIIGKGMSSANEWYIQCGEDNLYDKIYFADVEFGKTWFADELEANLALYKIEKELEKEEAKYNV